MSDSWEDEDFEVPVLAKPVAPSSWEDEEEDEVDLATKVSKPSPAAVEAALRKAREDELALETKVKLSLLEKETPEERKAREKRQVEEADNELTGELFGSGLSSPGVKSSVVSGSVRTGLGVGSTVLKTKQDHTTFGVTVCQKLADSSAFNIAAFYKSLSKVLETPGVTSEVIDEIYAEISRIRENKLKLEKPAKPAVAKKSKKDIKISEKKHSDVFGGSSGGVGKYDHYNDMEDDFM